MRTPSSRTCLASALVAATLAGCAAGTADTPAATFAATPVTTSTDGRTPTVTPSSTPPPPAEPRTPHAGTAVRLTIGDVTVHGELWDNPAARDLAARLPQTLAFGDHGGVEKIARLDPPLTMDGMPAGDDPDPGEIGWYAPSADLVLYHGDVGYWNGIARLGTFDAEGIALLADGPQDVTVTIASDAG